MLDDHYPAFGCKSCLSGQPFSISIDSITLSKIMFSLRDATLQTPHGSPIIHQADVDFTAHALHWVVGQSASGKTSLLKVLARDLPLHAGSLTIHYDALGIAIPQSRPDWRRKVGWISPSFPLIESDSLLDNICLPLTKGQGVDKLIARKAAAPLMQKLHLAPFADNRPAACPDGICLLAKVARSLIHDPAVVFCDAVFDYLDGNQQQNLYHCLESFTQGGLTVFVTSYAGPPVESDCVHTYLLDKGLCQKI